MPSIIQELTQLQHEEGWLPPEKLAELARRLNLPLHRLESVSTFYTHFRRTPPPAVEIRACRDLACALAGGEALCRALRERYAGRTDLEIREVSCLGRCDGAPAVEVGPRRILRADAGAVAAAVAAASADPGSAAPAPTAGACPGPHPFAAAEIDAEPQRRHETLLRTLAAATPAEIIDRVERSGLRGMGGAGFPTGRKWRFVAAERAGPKHVICNADESEPGTFKDRQILADLPHLVIEGMVLAGFAVGAEKGTVFIRHEYGPECRALERAIAAARARGALGRCIGGGDFSFDVEVFVSPGGYILGEETALLECMEDRRGEPRNKPPYPGTAGLFGRPTLINNVETLAHAAAIAAKGPQWWRALGTRGRAGHKFISVSGDVAHPGVFLVPLGTTLGELLEQAGGMRDGRPLLAVAPGGASSNFLDAACLDVPIDFQSLEEAGSMLGSGAAVFLAEGRDLLDVARNVTRFFRNESCGKCVPCRVGTEKAVALLEEAAGLPDALRARLEELDATLRRTSICGLGQVALGPLVSMAKTFRDRIPRG